MNRLFSQVSLFVALMLILTSCGTSKAVVKLMESNEYGIKKVHIENRNSTYDRLVPAYLESLRSSDEKFAEEFAKDTLLHMTKGACLGRCPVYSITIFNNGRVKYDGVNNVSLEGIYESKLEGSQEEDAKALIDKIELPRMYSRYPRGVDMVSDVATTKIVISDGTIKFPTTISYGQPDELKDIERFLEQLVSDLSWVQI